MKKFELTTDTKMHLGRKLFRIKALVSFGDVEAGDLGGYVEKEGNLDQSGDAWVYGNACVYDDACVSGNACVYDDAMVSDNACVSGYACVSGNACVYDDAWVYGNAWVSGNARVSDNARVSGNADYATVKGFGTQCRSTTFFKCEDEKIRVVCGCFSGTLEEFRKQVKDTRSGKIEKEYLMIADLMKLHFEEESEE